MLIKSVLRGARQKPLQFFSLVLFMALSSFIYVALEGSISSVRHFLQAYTDTTRQEDFFVMLTPPTATDIRERLLAYNRRLGPEEPFRLPEDFTLVDFYEDLVAEIGAEFDVVFDGRFYKDVFEERDDRTHSYRFIRETNQINLSYLKEGRLPEAGDEIAIFREYALRNQLEIGDRIRIAGHVFRISGFVAIPDYIYPIFSFDSPLFTPESQTLVLPLPEVYDAIRARELVLYSGRLLDRSADPEAVIAQLAELPGIQSITSQQANVRVSTIDFHLTSNHVLAMTFSGLLLIMSIAVLLMVLRKRIYAERVQIGILKALGYSTPKIIAGYLAYPLAAALAGSLTGFFLGVGFAVTLANNYVTNFVLPMVGFFFTPALFFQGVVIPILIAALASVGILSFLIKGEPIALMQENQHLKLSGISALMTKVLAPFEFETRFKYSLAFRNFGKLISLFGVVLAASIFLVFGFIAFDAVGQVRDRAFDHADFSYEVKFRTMQSGFDQEGATPFLRFEVIPDFDIVSMPFQFYGVDPDNEVNPLFNAQGENITFETANGLVINEFIARAYSLEVGDRMSFAIGARHLDLEITAIVDHFNGPMMYTSLDRIRHDLRLGPREFNGMWTSTRPEAGPSISYIFSMDELARNIDMGMEMIRVSLQLMVVIASLIGSFMIIIITNFIIEENQKQISILKVMGYQEQEISRMVLTIYFPFVLAAYLLAIIITRLGIDIVMNQIAARLPMAIPTDFTLFQALLGALLVTGIYQGATRISKLSLESVSLQEVLKQ